MPFGFGEHLFIVSIPLGVVSIALSKAGDRVSEAEMEHLITVAPFESADQLQTVRRSVAGFQQKPYPELLCKKRVRSDSMDRARAFQTTFCWLVFSPIVLLSQMLPTREETATVA